MANSKRVRLRPCELRLKCLLMLFGLYAEERRNARMLKKSELRLY